MDLSSSGLTPNITIDFRNLEENSEVNSQAIANHHYRRDSETFSQDSRQFDINDNSFIDTYRYLMDDQRICTQNNWNTWKKYVIAFCK